MSELEKKKIEFKKLGGEVIEHPGQWLRVHWEPASDCRVTEIKKALLEMGDIHHIDVEYYIADKRITLRASWFPRDF